MKSGLSDIMILSGKDDEETDEDAPESKPAKTARKGPDRLLEDAFDAVKDDDVDGFVAALRAYVKTCGDV